MFQRKDLPSILFLVLLIFIVVLTLCQILVVHRHDTQHLRQMTRRDRDLEVRKRRYRESIVSYNLQKYKTIARTEIYRNYIARLIHTAGKEAFTQKQKHEESHWKSRLASSADGYKLDSNSELEMCPLVPPLLRLYVHPTAKVICGREKLGKKEKPEGAISVTDCDNECMENYQNEYQDVLPGGYWKPPTCSSHHRVLLVIPFRDRHHHLVVLLKYLIEILQRQQLEFRILVVEQYGNATFNKGRLMNSAFLEAQKIFNFRCAIFHDVDLVPENDRNMYSCPWQPTHLSVAVDEMHYRLKYELLVGGVLAMNKEHFRLVNGYSNEYWGWGAEDDDMAYRILLSGLRIMRPPAVVARYKMLRHRKRTPAAWSERTKLLKTVNKRFQRDGLNNVPYTVKFVRNHKLYTHVMVDIGQPP